MSDLSNLYISQSYKGLINLSDSREPFISQSNYELTDGKGFPIGLSLKHDATVEQAFFSVSGSTYLSQSLWVQGTSSLHDTNVTSSFDVSGSSQFTGSVKITGSVDVWGNSTFTGSVSISGSKDIIGDVEITGSLKVSNEISSSTLNGVGNVTQYSQSVSGRLEDIENYTSSLRTAFSVNGTETSFNGDVTMSNDLRVTGDIFARKLHVLIESSSIVFSSGSNQLGDEPSDVQIFSGSVYVPNLHYLSGNSTDTNLRIEQRLLTSSFDSFSASLHTEQLQQDINLNNASSSLNNSILALSSSVSGGQYVQDGRLDALEVFTSSLFDEFVTEVEYSSSIAVVSGSLINQIDTKLNTSSFDSFSASLHTEQLQQDTNLTNVSQSVSASQHEQDIRIDTLSSLTSSYATTGSNKFNGSQEITGSVNGNVTTIVVSSNTASIDCSQGNFFEVQLVSGSMIHFTATNIIPGQTISLRSKTVLGAQVEFNTGSINFPVGDSYTPSQLTTDDILTFVSFDNSQLFGVAQNFFV